MGEYVGHLMIDGELIPVYLERGQFVPGAEIQGDNTSPWLTAEQAGAYIGSDRQRIADLKYQRKITPAGYDGRKPLYRREDLDTYLRGGN
jgi:hypothetical protein